jgi:diguanylate cyclase (GGDEF)-like protein
MAQSTTDPPAALPPLAADPAGAGAARVLAEQLGVIDALLFRRVGPGIWAHLGGLGRGRGWAGLVDVDEAADPLVCRIPAGVGEVRRVHFAEPTRVLGPYYAIAAAVVRISNDVAGLLGNPTGPLADVDDAQFRRLADLLDEAIDDVLPSKRLADELEVLHAVRALMQTPTDGGLSRTLQHLVRIATRALTCEIGVLRYPGAPLAIAAPPEVDLDEAAWHRILDEVDERMHGALWCAQDLLSAPSPAVAELLPQARALLALPLPAPGGTLLTIHTDRGPRGFTNQCQRLARHVVGTGSVLAGAAALRDDLHAAAQRASRAARTDPLTRLGNRLAWDEALASAQERVDQGASVNVITLDLDGLKQINDEHGHPAGDDLLRRCADTIRARCGPDDVAVRLGGDEFAILLPGDPAVAGRRYAEIAAALASPCSSRDTVAASVGLGTAKPGGRLADAVRDADVKMYRHKRQRRRQQASSDADAP